MVLSESFERMRIEQFARVLLKWFASAVSCARDLVLTHLCFIIKLSGLESEVVFSNMKNFIKKNSLKDFTGV